MPADLLAAQDLQLAPFAWFLEEGITVDGSAVAHDTKPDASPLTNWTDGSLGDLTELKFDPKFKEDQRMTPTTDGVWQQETKRRVLQWNVVLKTRQMGELVRRLEHGVAAKIVQGTAQSPGSVSDPAIYGWLKVQMFRESTGSFEIFDWWCKCTLDSANTFNENTPTPSLRFTLIKTVGGSPVDGNTVVWPEAEV